MNVLLFGATGMVGQGVLLECLADGRVDKVVAVVRRQMGNPHMKLREVVHADFTSYTSIEPEFANVDACFFCLGISSVGMSEADYTKITYDYAVAAATTLKKMSPGATLCFVSGAGTDSSEKGRTMWARVKGKTENAVLALFPEKAFMFRPGYIQPMKGVASKTALYKAIYVVVGALYPVFRALFPTMVTTSVAIGRAMIATAERGAPQKVLDSRDINELGR